MKKYKIENKFPIDLIKGIEYDLNNSVNIKDMNELIELLQSCWNSWFNVL